MAMSVGTLLAKVPLGKMADGDAFIVNDTWQGTGHLNDIVIVTPTFRRGTAVGLFACTLHVVDIGGRGVLGAGQRAYEGGRDLSLTPTADRGALDRWVVAQPPSYSRQTVEAMAGDYSQTSR